MKFKQLLILCLFLVQFQLSKATETTVEQPAADSIAVDSLAMATEAIESSLTYQTGVISLRNGLAKITVPKGYKYLDSKQSNYVLSQLWGNPEDTSTLGMLFPENTGPLSNFTYAIEVTYSEEGHIEDEDAEDLDYEDLLEEMKADAVAANPERKAGGYPEVTLVGWASDPFYDQATKKLHWAKELHFEGSELNTLNYNVRILGRSGFLNMNVIGDMTFLSAVKKDINNIIQSAEFIEGNTYADFNPSVDKVAAYGIGGLIAGKVLAKVGFFAVFLKFWKFLLFGLIAAGAAIKKFFFGEKNPYTKEESTQ